MNDSFTTVGNGVVPSTLFAGGLRKAVAKGLEEVHQAWETLQSQYSSARLLVNLGQMGGMWAKRRMSHNCSKVKFPPKGSSQRECSVGVITCNLTQKLWREGEIWQGRIFNFFFYCSWIPSVSKRVTDESSSRNNSASTSENTFLKLLCTFVPGETLLARRSSSRDVL